MTEGSATPAAPARLVTGSTLRHVITMTGASAIGLVAVFAVEALSLFYIGLLGQPELTAAMGYSGTLLFFATSVAIGMSIAGSALTARALGRGHRTQANQIAGAALAITLVVMAALTCLAYPLLEPAVHALGARGRTAELTVSLMRMVLPSWPLLGLGMCLSGLLRAIGDARRSMAVTLASAAATVVLDPLFIFGLGLGLEGVAASTFLARLAMVLAGAYGLVRVHHLFAWPSMAFVTREFRPFMAIGLPAVLTQIATPVGNTYVTATMAAFGDDAVAGWAVIQRIIPVAFGLLFAMSGAIGPIIGQNFGAQRFDRVQSTLRDALKLTLVYVLAIWVVLAVFGGPIADLFRATPEARGLIVFFCIFVAGSFLFNGALFVANAAFNNLGYAFYSTALNWGRSTLGVIPFVWLGQRWYGAQGAMAGYGLGVVFFGVAGCLLCFRVVNRLQGQVGPAPRG
jgi:putative MATE family efflux protein